MSRPVLTSRVKSCPVYASQGIYNENGKGKIMNEIEQLKEEIYQLRSENSMLKQDLLSAWRVLRLMYETLCEKCIKIEQE